MRDGLGKELLLGVGELRVVVVAVVFDERVGELVVDDVDLRVDGCSLLIVTIFAAGSHEPPCPFSSGL